MSIVDAEEVEEVVEVELAEEKSVARAVRSVCSAEIAVLALTESLDDEELDAFSGHAPGSCVRKAPRNDLRSCRTVLISEPIVDVEEVEEVEDELEDKSEARAVRALCNAEIAVLTLADAEELDVALDAESASAAAA